MRSSDEIKKGLVCCASSSADCPKECPYMPDCDGIQFLKDALFLIQQKERENETLTDDLIAERQINKEQLERIQQLEAERDAAVETIYEMAKCITEDVCEWCDGVECERLCMQHTILRPGFKWRGVQKEE